jgi:hypothetical protein
VTDFPSIVAALQSVRAASDIVKGLRAVEASYQQAEFKTKIAELAELLADARLSVVDAQEEIQKLRQRITELELAEELRDKLTMRDGVYYLLVGATEKGPYCVRCYESDQRLMPLTELPWHFQDFGRWKCPECEQMFGTRRE